MTSNPSIVTLLGRDHSLPGQVLIDTLTNADVSFGITSGKTQKPNQDALAVATAPDALLLAVADGHWGDEASDLAIQKAQAFLSSSARPPYGNEVRARLYALFDQINAALYEQALAPAAGTAAETTLIVCYVQLDVEPARLHWANFGDSYLFLKRGHQLKQLNTLSSCWLGVLSKMAERAPSGKIELNYPNGTTEHYKGVPEALETGIEIISPGDTLVLCTDGLMEPAGNAAKLTADDISATLAKPQPTSKQVAALIDLAMKHGGNDNIACIVATVPAPTDVE